MHCINHVLFPCALGLPLSTPLISKSTLEAVLRSLRRLPWDEDKALHAFMVDTLSNPHALTHQNQVCV
jgi:hypothetical protein